jgi:glycosyltransferase involved in cell wall biosynthesis/SAM-dependent methyltransferase
MSDGFYRALEERFRASREEIRTRLEIYQPFVAALLDVNPQARAFDIGCGRGEWLQMLAQQGIQAHGVDLDDSMLLACHECGLSVEKRDALEALRARPDNSLDLVSAFHVVEHLTFDYLRALLSEVHRTLAPQGLLILETPNAENLIVGTNNFYLDPTHQRPVPALFLDFLCRYSGFSRSTILRLQEDKSLHREDARIGLWQVLYGVSPDYAVVAQKHPPEQSRDPFQALLQNPVGLDLATLAQRHDERLEQSERLAQNLAGRLEQSERLAQNLAGRLEQSERRAQCVDKRLEHSEQRAQYLAIRLEHLHDGFSSRLDHLEHASERAEQELRLIHQSRSWRITRPLRSLNRLARLRDVQALKVAIAETLRPPLRAGFAWAERQPSLIAAVKSIAERNPRLARIWCRAFGFVLAEAWLVPMGRLAELSLRTQRLYRDMLRVSRELPTNEPGKPRLAYVSPLPPERTGIADYSAELLRALVAHYQVDIITPQAGTSDAWIAEHCPLYAPEWLPAHSQHYDAVLYHVGNSGYHSYMLDLLEQVPGIVVLHDFFLYDLLWAQQQREGSPYTASQALYYSHGYQALHAMANQADAPDIHYRYPGNLPILQRARGVIVHSEASRRLARAWYGPDTDAGWACIAHLRAPVPVIEREQARANLQLPADAFVVCSFGVLGQTKLNHRLLDAWLGSGLAADPACWLVFVGQLGDDDYAHDLLNRIQQSQPRGRIRITGWTERSAFRDYLGAADLAVQLRTHSRGETSGTVLDCMNQGLATIVNAHGSMADLPPEGVHRLEDAFTDARLSQALEYFRANPDEREALGQRARAIVVKQHSPERCAQDYQEAIQRFSAAAAEQDAQLRARVRERFVLRTPAAELLEMAVELARSLSQPLVAAQLLIDISATCQLDRQTGIERVARALTLALLQAPPPGYRVEPIYLVHAEGRWHYRYARAYTARLLGCIPPLPDQPLEVVSGDRLIALDVAGQAFVEASQQGVLRQLREQGVECHMLVHDLLPITHAELFPPQAGEHFNRWLGAVAQLDGAVCVTRSVAAALHAWLAEHFPERLAHYRIGHSHHGADLMASAPTHGLPADAGQILQAMGERPSLLMVGTLEPRKCYGQALEALSVLWGRGVDVNLVIVGHIGWQDLPDDRRRDIPALLRTLSSHPRLGVRLFWAQGASDEFLERLYASAHGLLAASADEGFGLPLIEAAQHGLPILARDIPVFREVAGEHARYFQADGAEQLADAIQRWLAEGFQPPSSALPWLTWAQSAANLARQITTEQQKTVQEQQ